MLEKIPLLYNMTPQICYVISAEPASYLGAWVNLAEGFLLVFQAAGIKKWSINKELAHYANSCELTMIR